jgi:hypothetical protein
MQRKMLGIYLLVAILILSSCKFYDEVQHTKEETTSSNVTKQIDTKAQVLKVYTDLWKNDENGWYVVPKNVQEFTIYAEVKNVDTVLFWLSETGTGTWSERQLIGYDQDGSDGFSLKWKFGNQELLDHILVQALGSDYSTMDDMTINVITSNLTGSIGE